MKAFLNRLIIIIFCILPVGLRAMNNYADNKLIIIPTAEQLLISHNLTEGVYVRTLGYYKENDGGGGLFKIQKTKPAKSETVLYYSLPNGLYANCMDFEVVLPRYGGVYVNQMLENAKPFLRPGIRDVIVLPPSNANHPGCSNYISGSGSRICFWQVNAPVLFDDRCSYSEVYLHDELVVASEVDEIEAVLKIAGKDKPEDITFVSPVLVGGRHLDKKNTIVAEHAVLIEDGARIIFGKLQAGFAKNCITLGGGQYSNEVEFYANFIEAGSCLERGLNIEDDKRVISFNIEKMHLQAPIGRNITWLYAHGNLTQSNIGTFFCTILSASKVGTTYKVFDIETMSKSSQVIDFDRIRISQCSDFGTISGGVYNLGTLYLTATPEEDINVQIGQNTTVICDYIQMANPIGNNWKVTGKGPSSVLQVNVCNNPPKQIINSVVTVVNKQKL